MYSEISFSWCLLPNMIILMMATMTLEVILVTLIIRYRLLAVLMHLICSWSYVNHLQNVIDSSSVFVWLLYSSLCSCFLFLNSNIICACEEYLQMGLFRRFHKNFPLVTQTHIMIIIIEMLNAIMMATVYMIRYSYSLVAKILLKCILNIIFKNPIFKYF